MHFSIQQLMSDFYLAIRKYFWQLTSDKHLLPFQSMYLIVVMLITSQYQILSGYQQTKAGIFPHCYFVTAGVSHFTGARECHFTGAGESLTQTLKTVQLQYELGGLIGWNIFWRGSLEHVLFIQLFVPQCTEDTEEAEHIYLAILPLFAVYAILNTYTQLRNDYFINPCNLLREIQWLLQ